MSEQDWVKVWKRLPEPAQPVELIVKLGPGREIVVLAQLLPDASQVRFASLATGEVLPWSWEAEYWRAVPQKPTSEALKAQAEWLRGLKA